MHCGRCQSRHHLVAVGRDFADVSPLRGVLQGGGAHALEVGVTVEPLLTPEDFENAR